MNEVRRGVVIVSVLLVLGGCGSDSASPGDSTPSPGGALTTTTSVEVTTTAAPITTVPATTATTAPPTAAPVTTPATTTAVIGQCATSAVALSTGPSDGAMGSIYTPLVFTNTGSLTCTLDGHPGVSFIDEAGNQIGPSVERTGGTTPTVALAPGEQAHAILQTHNAGLFGEECVPVPAHQMKVYPPDQTAAIIIAYDFDVCTGVIPEPQFFIDVVSPGSAP